VDAANAPVPINGAHVEGVNGALPAEAAPLRVAINA
jgi:hypothetical protein